MTEFWEQSFRDKQAMWGQEPTQAARVAAATFAAKGFKNILVPGIGYGRNAQAFLALGMQVTGIEISATAIGLAAQQYGTALQLYHGSVTDMPFDDKQYNGIFCHALIHLLDAPERAKLIAACYNQLAPRGLMIFTTITKASPTYGQGTLIGKDRYEQFGGVRMFFYDRETIAEAFGPYGLTGVEEITENLPFYQVTCCKTST